jgi:type VI secretion system secreted protein VgrG
MEAPMLQGKANQACYFFKCADLEDDLFEIGEFRGLDAISELYCFDIRLLSCNQNVKCKDLLLKKSYIHMYSGDRSYRYCGVISEFSFTGRNTDFSTYQVKLVPAVWLSTLNIRTRSFRNISVPDILRKVLCDLDCGIQFSINLRNQYPEHDYVVQYQESDFNFISRLMENNGIWFFFKDTGTDSEQLIITDNSELFGSIGEDDDVVFRTGNGLNEMIDDKFKESINDITMNCHVIPKEILIKNYNYRTPEIDLSIKKALKSGDAGLMYQYGGSYKNVTEASAAANVLTKRLSAGKVKIDGSGNSAGFRAGYRFTLSEHPRDDLNGTFLITQVIHSGSHSLDGASKLTYTNEFCAIPDYAAAEFAPEKKTVVPRINGIMTGLIDGETTGSACIDEMGRYKVRMHYDMSAFDADISSKYMRLTQPYSGSKYGFHFPSHKDAEMVFACIDGDPDKPVGLGVVPNAETVSPVVNANKYQNIIRTAGGNEILMDDTDGRQKVRIVSNGQNLIEIDDENRVIGLRTVDGSSILLDDKNQTVVWNAKENRITMSSKKGEEMICISTASAQTITMDDKCGNIAIISKDGNRISLDDKNKKITISDSKSKNAITMDGENGMTIETKGKLTIQADKDIEIRGSNVYVKSSSGNIDLKAAKELSQNGSSIKSKASDSIVLEASKVDLKGRTGVNIEGNITEIKAGTSVKVSANTNAEFSGNAVAVIKGGLVKIN